MTQLLSIILAAGEGTRMRSASPKVLHPVGGMPIVGHVARAARQAGSTDIAVITGPGHDAVRKTIARIDPEITFFEQTERKGTAHAARMARELLPKPRLCRGGLWRPPAAAGRQFPCRARPAGCGVRRCHSGVRTQGPHRLWPLHHRWRAPAGHSRAQGCQREPSAASGCAMPASWPSAPKCSAT